MNKYKRIILLLIFISLNIIMLPIIEIEARELSSSKITEKQLESIINNYGEENLIFENGLNLNQGEELDLSEFINNKDITEFSSYDKSIFEIKDNRIIAKKDGVTFLIGKSNSNYYVFQVYVASKSEVRSMLTEDRPKDTYLVYVDAGHGGKDPGAVANGIEEKELNLNIALQVRDKLKNYGISVVMNRETDVFVDFRDTAAHANSVNPHVFVSIHNNASSSLIANGIETFYTKEIDIPYGKEIHSRLIEYTGANNRGLKKNVYYVTKNTIMPAVLVEGGFLTNEDDANKLKTDAYQEKIANAIVDGIMEYLKNNVELNPEDTEIPEGSNEAEDLNKPEDSNDSNNSNDSDNSEDINTPDIPSNTENPDTTDEVITGWVIEDNIWYYYDSTGEKIKGWLKDKEIWYYLNDSGAMVTGWINLNGVWYYLNNSGAMVTGWINLNGVWYYLNDSGAMVTGWINLNGVWYYLNDSGAMETGWISSNDKWYYLQSSGAMATGWINISGTWYYLCKSGEMLTNTIIDGWQINENGIATQI